MHTPGVSMTAFACPITELPTARLERVDLVARSLAMRLDGTDAGADEMR